MDIYFVRHGETELNARHTHQPPSTPLNSRGRDQILSVAEYLRPMNPDLIITSDYQRTKETARLIGNTLGLQPEESALFREVKRPSSLYGTSHFNWRTVRYVLRSVQKRRDASWRMEDAENFNDIRVRVEDALGYLKSFNGKYSSIVVVSHTIFINLITAYMCKNRILDLRDLLPALLHVTRMKNGAILHLTHTGEVNDCDCVWEVVKE